MKMNTNIASNFTEKGNNYRMTDQVDDLIEEQPNPYGYRLIWIICRKNVGVIAIGVQQVLDQSQLVISRPTHAWKINPTLTISWQKTKVS